MTCRLVTRDGAARRAHRLLRSWIVLPLLLTVAWTAAAETQPAPRTGAEGGPAAERPEPEFAVSTTRDRTGRIVVPVQLNGNAAFRFILDTGANRSAISQRVVTTLGVAPDELAPVNVHGITGSAAMPIVRIADMRVGALQLGEQRVLVLPDAVFGGLDGILGIDCLQQSRIDVDFDRDRVVVRPSPGARGAGDGAVLRAKLHHGGLLLLDSRVGRVRAKAILDTGAQRSLGNQALREALMLRAGPREGDVSTTVIGATAQVAQGETFMAPVVDLGGMRLSNLRVTFGDLHVFRVWSLLDEPALLIGMDLLGTLRQFSVDYPRREFHVRTRHSSRAYDSTYGPRHSGGPGFKE